MATALTGGGVTIVLLDKLPNSKALISRGIFLKQQKLLLVHNEGE